MEIILLVEDNKINADMLSRRLQRRGFTVYLAVDGTRACDMASELKPDLIIMDMSLPGMDGWEATRRIKSDAVTTNIPIIGLSAHAMSGDKTRAMKAGCDDYDTKPVDMERLLEKINNYIPAVSPIHESERLIPQLL